MISFLHPAFLWSLAVLAVPVVIHLLSRKEGAVILVGSLRHLSESNTKQSLSIRLNEWLLLLLRFLFVLLLGLLMSGLQWSTTTSPGKWMVIEKGVVGNEQVKPIIDSLKNNGFEVHFLAPGFPLQQDSLSNDPNLNYWDLVSSLESLHLAEVVVFSNNLLQNFNGRRLALPKNITWIPVEPQPKHNFTVKATRILKDSLRLRLGHSASAETYFETVKLPAAASDSNPEDPDTLQITIVYAPDFSQDKKILTAALEAMSYNTGTPTTILEVMMGKEIESNPDWLIWLSNTNLPPTQIPNILLYEDNQTAQILEQKSPGRLVLTKRLNEEIAVKENLSLLLAEKLLSMQNLKSILSLYDVRAMNEKMLWTKSNTDNQAGFSVPGQDRSSIILLFMMLVLVFERFLSYKRRQ